MQVLKLGGSVITFKDKVMTADHEGIRRLSDEIKTAWPLPLVLVHGGGSFGHPVAKKYRLTEGYKSMRQVAGFAKTHRAMIELNSIIVDALLEKGVPAISISPSSFILTKEGRIDSINLEVIGRLVVRGILPVLFGDVVIDSSKGFTILSGDQLAVRLAIDMGAERLIFGVDVDGVYTSNPKLVPEARIIRELPREQLKGYIKIGEALTTDVTGGMLGKVSEARDAVEAGVEVLIANATSSDVILKALRGESVTGTILKR